MVQRKLGIQADHVISEMGSSPTQNQDNKNNKGADLKKKMKKSRSPKLSDSESLRSTPPLGNKDVPQPGKPPSSDHVKTRAATPLRQSPAKAPEASPNYMKSTSSFDARKEQSLQVSSQTPQNVMIRKSTSPMKSNNSRHSSGSDYKTVGGLARTSNLKLVRTLTKTPSFKPARASTMKYSPIALCEEFDVQKPTCSSTLKDSKFPTYLELSTGATESEGTSAMKVCPYTYCSLNGHHHDPVPPLKSFLSAKRRMLKAQKIMKLGCLSPRRAKSSCLSPRRGKSSCLSPRRAKSSRERMIKIEAKQVILAKIPPTKKKDSSNKPVTPLTHEKQTDLFVEIYSNNRDGISKGETPESLSLKAPCPVIDFEENPDQSCGKIAATPNDIMFFNQNSEASADIHPVPIAQEDPRLGWLSTQSNSDEESWQNSKHGQSDADASDMEWEAGNHCEPNLSDVKITDIHNESKFEPISKPVNDVNNSYEDMLAEEVQVGSYDEKSVSSDAWSVDSDSDLDGLYQNMFFDESCLSYSEQKIQGKLYSTSDALDDSTGDGQSESIVTVGTEITSSHHTEEFQATSVEKKQVPESSDEIQKMNSQLGPDAMKCSSDVEEVLFELQEDEASQEQYVGWLLQNQNCNSVQDFLEQDQDETHNDYYKILTNMEVFPFDFTSESRFINVVSDGSFSEKTKNEEACQEDHDQKISLVDARDGMAEKEVLATELLDGIQTSESLKDCEQEQLIADASDVMEEKEQLLAAKSLIKIQPFKISQEFPEPIQNMVAVSSGQSNQTDVSIESKTNQTYADELKKDQIDTCKFTGCRYPEDQKLSEAKVLRATPKQSKEADAEEGEYKTEPDTAETSFIVTASTNTQKSNCVSNASSDSAEQVIRTVENSSWTYGSRKAVAELEDIRDFNPREPNYLPVEPDLEAEKVDLRHQLIDERKNAEEWMVDYALRQAVTKLAPARKRKVSLLVEAFEKVLPTPKYETQPRRTSPAFVHAGTVQACR